SAGGKPVPAIKWLIGMKARQCHGDGPLGLFADVPALPVVVPTGPSFSPLPVGLVPLADLFSSPGTSAPLEPPPSGAWAFSPLSPAIPAVRAGRRGAPRVQVRSHVHTWETTGHAPHCIHPDRAAGGDRDHRHFDRPAVAGRPEGPRGRRTDQVFQQPQ